jgi:hypothetical protein
MKSKRLPIILKIFTFLLFTIGILYICQYFNNCLTEGFQTTVVSKTKEAPSLDPSTGCRAVFENNRNLILCSGNAQAYTMLSASNMATYLPNSNDNLCVHQGDMTDSMYYTCYNRPAPMIFDALTGIYRASDPMVDDDETPDIIAPNIDVMCGSYSNATNSVKKSYTATIKIFRDISGYISSIISYSNSMSNVSTNNCKFGHNQNYSEACKSIQDSIVFFRNLPTSSKLTEVLQRTSNTIINLRDLSGNVTSNYNGTLCEKYVG